MTNPIAAILFAASFTVASAANARSNETPDDSVDQIIVTGARTPISLSRIGSATTIISRADIERRQVRYVTDLLRAVPGFAVSQSGAIGAQTQVRVRGSESNHVLVLIDGIRANDPASGDDFRWEHLSTAGVERIEIVRGPQSALWGSDAIGAVVNVITRNDSGRPGFDAFIESGSHGTANFGASGAARLGNWTFNAGLDSLDTDGINISRSGSERDGADLKSGAVGARYLNERNLSIDVGLRGNDANSQFDPVDFFVTGLPADGRLVSRSNNLAGHFALTLPGREDHMTWQLRARYFDSEHRNFADGARDSSTAADRISYALQADLRLGENRLSLALEHASTDFEQRGAVVFGDPNQNQDMQVASLVAEYQYLGGERFTWVLGGRFDKHSDFNDAVTGKLSTAYQWTDTTRFRASVGNGHKTPTFIERFGFFPDQFVGNPDLEPETSLSWDVGFDQQYFDGALSLGLSLYRQKLRDEINGFVFDPQSFLFTAGNRSGESERTGAELEARWQLSDRFSVAANYTYTDSTEQNDAGEAVDELRRPRHAGSLSLDFAQDIDRFQASLVADYGGKRLDLFFPPFPSPQQTVSLDSYWLVDLTAQLRVSGTITVFARGSNLLDEDYEQVFGYRTLKRSGYLGVRVEFGE